MSLAPWVLVPDPLSFLGVARVIITAKQALVGEYVTVLQRLVDILHKVAPNPSNPNFDQYIFESISGLIRFIGATVPDSITVFESALFPPFTEILQKDIDRTLSFQLVVTVEVLTVAEYIAYVFHILAQMLTLHQGVPVDYRALLPHLLTPAIWAQSQASSHCCVPSLRATPRRWSRQTSTRRYWALCSRGSYRVRRMTGGASSSYRASCYMSLCACASSR